MGADASKGVYIEKDIEGNELRVVEGTPPERGSVLIAPGTVPDANDLERVKIARRGLDVARKAREAAEVEERLATDGPAEVAAVDPTPTPVQLPETATLKTSTKRS